MSERRDPPHRFEVLDSWRGVSALMIVVYHLDDAINWSLHDAPVFEGFHLFVDFFFVLSGFVIASAYRSRLAQPADILAFVVRRFTRLYPLHIVTLLALLALRIFLAVDLSGGFDAGLVFNLHHYSPQAFAANLLLLNSMGVTPLMTWNAPSWSIGAEFYTYLLFAGLWSVLARAAASEGAYAAAHVAMAALCAAALLALSPDGVGASYDLGVLRAAYGFAVGALAHQLYTRRRAEAPPSRRAGTLLEIGTLAACAIVIWRSDVPWLATIAPVMFALPVLVFAFEAGAISSVLRRPVFVWIGALSYSIYMVHFVVIIFDGALVEFLRAKLGVTLTATLADGSVWDVARWIGNLVLLANLALVIAISAATYTYVEKPARAWGRRAANRLADSFRRRRLASGLKA